MCKNPYFVISELDPNAPSDVPKREGSAPPLTQEQIYPQYQAAPGPYPAPTFRIAIEAGQIPPPINVSAISFGELPQQMTCPYCHEEIVTQVRPKDGLLTWLLCGGLLLVGCWICCCLPFCFDRSQDVEHYCSECKQPLGIYRRI